MATVINMKEKNVMSSSGRLKLLVFALFVICGLVWLEARIHPAYAQAEKATPMARYTIVESDGTNLLVTDNVTNTLYFYVIDRDAQVGSDLKIRGSIDLNEVGKP